MVKVKLKDVKKELAEEQNEIYQEEAPGGTEQGLDSDDDTDERYKSVIGHDPIPGEEIDEEIDAAEELRHGRLVHKNKSKKTR